MKFRFIEFEQETYLVVGITYDYTIKSECFVAVHVKDINPSIRSISLNAFTRNIPLLDAVEIVDKNKIAALMVLYG